MSKLTQLRLGVGVILLLVLGLVWMPSAASAAPGDPQMDSSGPSQVANSDVIRGTYGDSYGDAYNDAYNDAHNGDAYNDEYSRSSVCESGHRVALGENLTQIAAAYGVSVEDLASENGLDDTNLIYENQTLCIPAHGYGSSGNDYQANGSGGGYGDQNNNYGQPGQSYDPSNSYPNQSNGYGEQSNSYGDQNNNYGQPGQSYDPANSYPNQSNGYDSQNNNYGQPGQSYDPSNSYPSQGNGYGEQSNGYGSQRNGDDLQPGQSRWSSE